MYMWRYLSISWLICSVCPSVCGWNAVDGLPFMSSDWYRLVTNFDTNWCPLSLMTFSGNPCSLNTWSLNILAYPSAVIVVLVGIACVCFVSLSTMTRMALYPQLSGSSPMMSTDMTSHGLVGISLCLVVPFFFVDLHFSGMFRILRHILWRLCKFLATRMCVQSVLVSYRSLDVLLMHDCGVHVWSFHEVFDHLGHKLSPPGYKSSFFSSIRICLFQCRMDLLVSFLAC